MTLDDALRGAAERAHAEHPHFRVDEAGFRAHLKKAGKNDAERIAGLNAGDLLLAYATLARDPAATAELDRRLVRATKAAIGGRANDDDMRGELIQRVRDRILVGQPPRLAGYEGDGALVKWVRVIALSVAVDARRRDRPDQHAGDSQLIELASSEAGADQSLDHKRHRAAITEAFKAATEKLEPRQRLILRMRYVDQVTADDIGRALGIHRTNAMRALDKATADLHAGVREHLRSVLGLTARQVDSLLDAVRPSIAERLSRILTVPK